MGCVQPSIFFTELTACISSFSPPHFLASSSDHVSAAAGESPQNFTCQRFPMCFGDWLLFYQHFGLQIRSSPWKCIHSQPATIGQTVLHNKSASWSHALVLLNPLWAERHSTEPQWAGCSLYFDIVPTLICMGDQRQWLKHANSLQTIRLCSLILIDYIVFFLLNSFGRLTMLSHPTEAWMVYHAIDKHGFEP